MTVSRAILAGVSNYEAKEISDLVNEIVSEQKKVPTFDYRPKLAELDSVIAKLYALTKGEQEELLTWYPRHYPKLTGEGTEEGGG